MSPRRQIEALEVLRAQYGPEPAAKRRALIEEIESAAVSDPDLLLRYHEALLFLRAYPDDEAARASADRALSGIGPRVSALDEDGRAALQDSGLPGTRNVHTYSWAMLRELLPEHGKRIEYDWEGIPDSAPLFDTLSRCVAPAEVPAIDDDRIEGDDWLVAARGPGERSDIEFVHGRIEGTGLPELLRESLYDRLELPARWEIRGGSDARTTSIRRTKRTFHHGAPLERHALPLAEHARKPLASVERLPRAEAIDAIRWMNGAMSVRNRELYPLCHPDARDVMRVTLDRGLVFYTYGVRPPRRLLIEGLFGQFLTKNGVPIGYALASVAGRACEIGLNVYDTFRAGENALVYAELVRVFHQLYGAELIWVPRLQAGYGNEEGLASGAYWFYDKLGFRSMDPKIERLAARERARRFRDPDYRAPRRTLERLVGADLWISLSPALGPQEVLPLGGIAFAVTRWITVRFGGDRARAAAFAERIAERRIGPTRRWGAESREAFTRLAPLVALIPDWREWSAAERRDLSALVRAKGGPREGAYVRRMQRHGRWLRFLRALGALGA